MKQFLTVLGTATAIALAAPAFATDGPSNSTDYKAKDNGGYEVESKSEMTTKAGTDKKGSRMVDVDIDDDGKVSKDTKTKNSSDPEGLMNAKSNVEKSTFEDKENGGYEAKAVSEHKDAAGTNRSVEVKTDVEVNDDGSVDKTVEKTKVVDPKGLMNKEKTTVKTVNGKVVND